MHRDWRGSLTMPALLFAGAVVLLLVALAGFRLMAPPALFDAGHDLRFDDFDFTALRAEAAPRRRAPAARSTSWTSGSPTTPGASPSSSTATSSASSAGTDAA